MSFERLGLRAELLKAVEARGYAAPTPIQAQAIPVILAGRDILAGAQTGTGKTDAFALPLVEILGLGKTSGRHPRALVLTPTRELALQVGERIKDYARRVSLRCTVAYGGVRIEPQIHRLRRGVDILVATPGRLLDLAFQRHLKLSRIEFLVFDEADRMLDLGFHDDVSEIIDLLPKKRRTMLFSATYSEEIEALAGQLLENPRRIQVTPQNTAAESVLQRVHRVERSNKRPLLFHLIETGKWERALVFTRTKHGANKLADRLARVGITAAAIHSDKSQVVRSGTLEAFKKGEVRILVATDVAARGLDIRSLPYVVNYDMPDVPEDYVHRIGRTGRAGKGGIAVSLVSPDEKRNLDAVQRLLKRKIPVKKVDGYTEGCDIPDFVISRPGTSPGKKGSGNPSESGPGRKKRPAKPGRRNRPSKTTRPGRRPAAGAEAAPESGKKCGKRGAQAGRKPHADKRRKKR